ncbi:MAG TPA: hypothetical protein PLJ38_09580 [bacterium]|mgnify:CR=1 FL=1|nr:hypothetical protein [bacterium]
MLIRLFFLIVLVFCIFFLMSGFVPEVFFSKLKLTFRLDNLIMFVLAILSSIILLIGGLIEIRSLKSKLRKIEAEYSDLKEKYEELQDKIDEN